MVVTRCARACTASICLAFSLLSTAPAAADAMATDPMAADADEVSACVAPKSITYRSDSVGFVAGKGVSETMIRKAIGLWQECDNYASDFPLLQAGEPGTRTIYVDYVANSSGAQRCGVFRGNRITLYRSALDQDGRPTVCGALWQNLAHELGHVLGLRDLGFLPDCSRHIMASISPSNRLSRRPKADECRAVGERWITLAEIVAPESEPPLLPPPAAESAAVKRRTATADR